MRYLHQDPSFRNFRLGAIPYDQRSQRVREILEEQIGFNEKKCLVEYATCLMEIWLVVFWMIILLFGLDRKNTKIL